MKVKPFSDKEYGKILDNLVVVCVDTAITHEGKILLVRRDQEPAKNAWWIFGGRVNKGEELRGAARRGIYQELNLWIDDDERFSEIGVFNLIWPIRREATVSNGCHHLLIAHQIEINEREKNRLDIITVNDSAYRWFELRKSYNDDLLPQMNSIVNHARSFGTLKSLPML